MSLPKIRALWRSAAEHPGKTAFLIALVVRLVNLALLRGNAAFFAETDSMGYWALGTALANADTFASTFLSTIDRMPLYPLFLAGVQSLFGDAPRLAALLQAAIDAGTCAMIATLGALISPLVGLIAGILAALSVNLVIYSSQILTDCLFLFFFTLWLLAGARFMLRPSKLRGFLAGLAGGLALATRPAVAVLLFAAVPLVCIVAAIERRRLISALAVAFLFASGALLPIAPVLVRNAFHYGSYSLTSQTGEHLLLWIVPLVTQRANGTPYQETVDRMKILYAQRVTERGKGASSNPFRLAAIETEIAREEMTRLPLSAFVKAWIEGMIVNVASPAVLLDPRVRALPKPSFYNTPGTSLWEKSRAYVFDDPGLYQVILIVGLLATLPILALETIGFVMLARTHPWAALFGGGVLAYFLLVSGPVAGPKYRLPMEPVLIVLAALPVAWLLDRRDKKPRVDHASAT